MHYFELRHGGFIPLCPWQIFVRGCFCWALPLLLFALLFCWMAKRISGWGICVSPFVWLFLCLFFVVDLPCYMTTGVNVEFISNCFFTCKDRALERDWPYQRKKKQYEAYAGFHVIQLLTDGAPILLFSNPTAIPQFSPWDLCAAGNLGSMESNVMAGRALFGCLQLPDGQRRCAIFLVHEKVTQGASKSADYRAYRHIAPKSLELVVVSQPVAEAFCGRLLLQHLQHATYFDRH